MKQAQVMQAIERIENDIARLQAEAAALRARVSSAPPPASHPARKATMAFPSPKFERADEAAPNALDAPNAQSALEPSPTTARDGSAPRVQHAVIPVDTIPPASRSRSSARAAAKARDTIPVPAPSISEPPREPSDDDEASGGRYGFVSEARTKSSKPK